MNVLSTGAFALPPAIIYRRSKSLKSAAIGLAVGVVAMTALMLAWNYIITPLYMKVPREVVAGMLIPTFLPFNLVKGGLNAGIAILVYKPVTDALRRAGLLMPSSNSDHVRRFNLPMTIAAVVLVITCAIVFALMSR